MLPLLISAAELAMFTRKLPDSSGPEIATSLKWTAPMKLREASSSRLEGGRAQLAGKLPDLAILPSRLSMHPNLVRRNLQRLLRL